MRRELTTPVRRYCCIPSFAQVFDIDAINCVFFSLIFFWFVFFVLGFCCWWTEEERSPEELSMLRRNKRNKHPLTYPSEISLVWTQTTKNLTFSNLLILSTSKAQRNSKRRNALNALKVLPSIVCIAHAR